MVKQEGEALKTRAQVTRYRNGQVRDRISLRNGVRHGTSRTWHRNGQLASQERYLNGLLDGRCQQWGPDGRLLGESTMAEGTGIQREWHDNGKLKIEVSTVEGKFCGRNRIWLRDGTLISERFYLHGRAVSRSEYLRAKRLDPDLPALPDSPDTKRLRSARRIELRAHETHVEGMLERGTWREVRQSLGPAEESRFPSLGRFPSVRAALGFGESLYAAGAREVLAPDIYQDRRSREFSDWLVVRLPRTAAIRRRIRRACAVLKKQKLGVVLPSRDIGESFLLLALE